MKGKRQHKSLSCMIFGKYPPHLAKRLVDYTIRRSISDCNFLISDSYYCSKKTLIRNKKASNEKLQAYVSFVVGFLGLFIVGVGKL